MTLISDSLAAPVQHQFDRTQSGSRRRHLDAPANLLLLAALWLVYAAVRNLTTDTQHVAISNASRLLDIESALGLDIEGILQSAIDWPQAFVVANTYYLLHFPITLTVMVLAFWRRRTTVFPVLRNSLIGCTALALVIHLIVPMAPPRMLPGFVDTGATFGPDPYAIAGSESANQFAAMPSMHVAWAILCGFAVVQLSRHRAARWAGVLHPILTSLVVIVTGHHFVSDVAIGAGLAVVLLIVAIQVAERRQHPRPPFGGLVACEDATIGGSRITPLPDDLTGGVLHTDFTTSTTRIQGTERSHELRPPATRTDDPRAAAPPTGGDGCRSPNIRHAAATGPALCSASLG